MISKKNRAAIGIPPNAVLNCDDRKKFSAFVALLVQVNKRINPEEYTVAKNTRSKKTKKSDLNKSCGEGSQYRGPLLFLIMHALSLWELFKYFSSGIADDRHRSFTSSPRFISNY